MPAFPDKSSAREHVWDRLEAEGEAAFPFPPHGRIPNFRGASKAAERLLDDPIFEGVRRIKVNPDAPQRALRALALARGIELLVPTPRLRAGFRRLRPDAIDAADRRKAVSLSGMERFGEPVALEDLPPIDLIVTGCAAITRDGRRCGKGEGYSDLEFAILRELGHPAVPVVTTVHPMQVVDAFPVDDHDIGLHAWATPDAVVHVESPRPAPPGIDWSKLDERDLEAMPVLARLRERTSDG